MIEKHVKANVSLLVATLASGVGKIILNVIADNDLSDAAELAAKLAAPIDDYEEAAREAGWKHEAPDALWTITDGRDEGYTAETAQEACEIDDIEPYQREVYEHWTVSDWLAERLIAEGERVDSIAELPIWARTRNCPVAEDPAIVAIWAGTPPHNHVYNRAEHGEPHPEGLPFVFEAGEEDNFFATEDEACTAQRDFRRAHGLNEMTGE